MGGNKSGLMTGVRPRVVIDAYKRQEGRCLYCHDAVDENNATWEHIVPRAWGGAASGGNEVLACEPCNGLKSGIESMICNAFDTRIDLASKAALFVLHCSVMFRRKKVQSKARSKVWKLRYFWMAHHMMEQADWHINNQAKVIPHLNGQMRDKFI